MNCTSCRHGEPILIDDPDELALQCRRFPPQLFVQEGSVSQAWPQMGETDWCGEHQLKAGS